MHSDDLDETHAAPAAASGKDASATAHGRRGPRGPTLVLCALLVAAGLLGWSLLLRSPLAVDTGPLSALPYRIGGWQGQDVPVEDDVARLLQADFNLQRVYADPLGGFVWFYVGYYGTDRGGRTDHTPWVCYPSAGWTIVQSDRLTLDASQDLHVNEILVERAGERRLVHFWFRSHRATGIRTTPEQLLDRMLGRLLSGRADGAFVRVSTPIDAGGISEARARLSAFAVAADARLDHHWPTESSAS